MCRALAIARRRVINTGSEGSGLVKKTLLSLRHQKRDCSEAWQGDNARAKVNCETQPRVCRHDAQTKSDNTKREISE